jgi:hypothetical protein
MKNCTKPQKKNPEETIKVETLNKHKKIEKKNLEKPSKHPLKPL